MIARGRSHWRTYLIAVFFLLLGAFLRLVWVHDMEWKGDQIYIFQVTQSAGVTAPWPSLGMPSGAGLRNPGMSLWLFIVLKKIFAITTPIGLDYVFIGMNIAALALLFGFALFRVEEEDRMSWLWAGILASVNVTAVEMSRKIWQQCALPFFAMLLIYAWWSREKKWGAFVWGFLGALVGQIHMSGFFFSAALAAWTFLFGEKTPEPKKPRWRAWLLGSVLGALPLIPWVMYLLADRGASISSAAAKYTHFYFWLYWVTEPLGLQVVVNLGRQLTREFLGSGTGFLVGSAYALVLLIAAFVFSRRLASLWRNRRDILAMAAGRTQSALFLNASFWGFGILITAAWIAVYRHYLLVAFPLTYLWLVRQVNSKTRWGSRALAAWVVLELLISVSFLVFIHRHHGALGGDYGIGYRWR